MQRWEQFKGVELLKLVRQTRWALENNKLKFLDLIKVKKIEDIYMEGSIYLQIGKDLLEGEIKHMNKSIELLNQLLRGETREIHIQPYKIINIQN